MARTFVLQYDEWRQEVQDVDKVIGSIILMTAIAYLAIRLIVFWNASRTSKDREHQ
jgi:hypothetical protein